jgi:signal transduction histidine kinase
VFPSLALGSLGILSWRPEPFFRVLLFALWGLLAVHLVWTGQARRFITAQYSEQKINQPILEIVELSRALPHILRNWDWEEQIPFFPILEDREALADFLSDGLNLNVLNIDYRLEISRPGRLVSSVQTRPFPPCRFPDREGVWTEGDETSHARFPLMAGGSPWGWVDLHFSPRSPVLSGKEPLPVQTGMYDLEGRRLESGSIFLPARLSPRSLGRLNGIVTQYQEGNRILLFYLPSWENPFPYLLFAGILLGGILLSLPFPLRPRSFLFLAVVPFLVLLSLTMLLALLLTARQNRDLVRLVNQWNSSVQQSLLASTERLSPTLTYTAGVLSGGERIRASARFCPDAVMARPPSLRPVVHPLEGENYLFFMDTEGRINALLQPTLPDLGRPLAWQSQRTWGLLLGLLSFSLMGLLLLARRFASPIQDMALAARRVQKGDLFNPEISLASEELRDLGEALKASITRLQSEDRTLKEILTALPAGIALFSGSTCLFRNAPMEGLQLPDDQAAGLPVAGTQSRDGRLLQFQKVPLPGERWLLIVRDITSEEAARKLQGFADIARIVAHEVKNPLTPIRLSLDYLRDLQTRDPQRFQKEAKAVLAEILGSVEDLEKAALEFSDFARLPALKKECVDLAELLEAWLNPFTASGRIVFLSSGSARVEVDTRLFKRALFNLINNGWQSASPPPRVHVQVRGGDHVEIHVRDEGPGLEPEARAHLFEPYFTTKTSGTGLGLLIARKIIEEHGGTLSLGPEGPGLHLIISLPKTGEGDSLSRPD